MSVTVRPYVNDGWEVDIRVQLPDGSVIRERKKAAASSKQAAQKWAESRERILLVHGKPKPAKEDAQKIPTLKAFALRFLDGYAKANRLKPSGIASKETVLLVHLAKAFGDKRLDEISTEDVQRLKAALTERAPKTVNNVLTVLSVALPKGGRIRYVPMTKRLTEALREARHLRGPRVLCDGTGKPLTQKIVQVLVRRPARRANVKPGIHIQHTFCSHLAMRGAPARAIQELAGHQDLGTTQRYMHLSPAALDAAIRLLETGTETSRAAVEK